MSHTPRRTLQERARRHALADAATNGAPGAPPRCQQTRFTPLQRLRRRNLADIASGFEPTNSEESNGGST
jgi:hypothetical protein